MKRLTFDALLAATMMIGPVAWARTAAPGTTGPGGDEKVMVPDPNAPSATGAVPAQSQQRERNTTPVTTPAPTTPDDSERNGRTGDPPGTQSAPAPTNPHIPGPTDTPSVPGATAGMEGDLAVVAKVHEANQKEIELAQMALDRAESPRVKAYARKLLNDHQATDKKLLTYADQKALDRGKVEQTPPASKADDDAHARLLTATGADFDRQFITMMLDEHDKAIDLVKSAKDSVTDRQLRTFLASVLPKLEQHRKMARELADKQAKT
jgi:putative membrane protein